MNKFTTLMALAAMVFAGKASATVYNGQLQVNVNGSVSEQAQPITIVTNGDECTLSINNFCLTAGGEKMGVGNIVLKGKASSKAGDVMELSVKDNVEITAGTDPSISMWMGPILGQVPIDMKATFSSKVLNTTINIDMMSTLQQIIKVSFISDGLQFRNPGFENFHNSSESGSKGTEPNGWHSFTSATGGLAKTAGVKVAKSEVVRPGTDGQASAVLHSSSILGVIANGTMTTGRLNASSLTAADPANHSFLDMSKNDKDGNGDPFYTEITNRPDSLNVWVKFKQEKANSSYPYATVSAAITNGTNYQDPEGSNTYTNVMAKAANKTIATNGNKWQQLSVPFNYVNDKIDPKAILVTFSTNATPGKGGGVDSLYVDDIKLVYNSELDSIKFRGAKLDGWNKSVETYNLTAQGDVTASDFSTFGRGQVTNIDVQEVSVSDRKSYVATITSYAADMSSKKVYTVNITGVTGVNEVGTNAREIKEIYNLQGVKVSSMERGGVYVVRYTDGTAAKVIKH